MMDEPRRLLEDSESGLEHALLRAGTSYKSSERARVRTMVSLGLAGSATMTAGSAFASSLVKSGWAKVLAISALAGAASIPVISAMSDSPATTPNDVAVVTPPPVVRAAKSPDPAAERPAEAEASPTPELVPPPAPQRTARAATPTRASAQGAALAAELAALDAARSALGSGDPRRALALLDGYAKSHPRGRMQVEAEVLRIDALAKAGQKESARKRAEAFLRRQPNSVLASRVRTYL